MNDQCPKCGAPRAIASCPKCGLEYGKYNPAMESAAVPSVVAALWQNVEDNWSDLSVHALFVEQGLRNDAAGFIATCYRKKGDDVIAKEQLEKLTGRLIQTLQQQSTPKPEKKNGLRMVVYVLMFVLMAALAFVIFAHGMN